VTGFGHQPAQAQQHAPRPVRRRATAPVNEAAGQVGTPIRGRYGKIDLRLSGSAGPARRGRCQCQGRDELRRKMAPSLAGDNWLLAVGDCLRKWRKGCADLVGWRTSTSTCRLTSTLPIAAACHAAGRAMGATPRVLILWPRQALQGLAPVARCGRIRGRICRANDMFTNVW